MPRHPLKRERTEARKRKREEAKRRKVNHQRTRNHHRAQESPNPEKDVPSEDESAASAEIGLTFSEQDLAFADHGTSRSVVEAAADDDSQMIDYLERKLGIKDDKSRMKGIAAEIAKEEFGGDDILQFVDDILEGREVEVDSVEGLSEKEDSDHAAAETSQEDSAASSCESVDTSAPSSSGSSADASDTGLDQIEDETSTLKIVRFADDVEEKHAETRRPGTVRKVDCDAKPESPELPDAEMQSDLKYIPPHLRKTSPGPAGNRVVVSVEDLRPKFRSQFNRVAEGNLNLVIQTILSDTIAAKESLEMKLISQESESVQEALKRFVRDVCDCIAQEAFNFFKAKAATDLLAPQIAMLAGLSALVSPEIIPYYLKRILKAYATAETNLIFAIRSGKGNGTALDAGHQEVSELASECLQAVAGVSLLFYFGVLDANFLLEFVSHIAKGTKDEHTSSEIRTRHLQFLSLIVRLTGPDLNLNHPDSYHTLTSYISEFLADLDGVNNMHIDFLRHELSRVGGSKLKKAPIYEKYAAMRGWLRAKSGQFRQTEWDNIVYEPNDPRKALQALLEGLQPSSTANEQEASLLTFVGAETSEKHRDMANLAKALRIKTPIQQQVFAALVGAEDVGDAIERILKIARTRAQMPHVVAVMLHCATQERVYNVYYEEVFLRLCSSADEKIANRFRRSVRQGLHTLVGALEGNDKETLRKKAIVAKLTLALVRESIIPQSETLMDKFSTS